MSAVVDQAFLSLLNHSGELLRELGVATIRLEGALKMRVDGLKAAHSHAMSVAKFANTPAQSEAGGGPFDGGPISPGVNAGPGGAIPKTGDGGVPPQQYEQAQFDEGATLAREDKPLPAEASTALKRGYYSVKPPDFDPAASG